MTREEAIQYLNKLYTRAELTDVYGDMEDMTPYEEALDMAIQALEQEQKTGFWKRIGYDIYECSICGQNVMTGDIYAYKHCHGCGVNMESEETK